ncbi:MAG: transporter substrate-binding domain-containing protein [Caldilineaceae bacterium]
MIAGVKYDFDPFGYIDSSGKLVGFDVDLVQAIADQWGVKVEFVPVTSSARLQLLATGVVDLVAASMTHTLPREATIDFSQTYFLDRQRLLVRANTTFTALSDLKGKTIAAIQGSTSLDNIRELVAKENLKISILPFQEYPPALAALKAGQVDALTTDSAFLAQAAKKNPDLRVVGEPFSLEPYGIGVAANDSYFRDLVNYTLELLKSNGKYDQLYTKWFPDAQPYPIEILPGRWPYMFATMPTTLKKPAETRQAMIRRRGKLLAGVKYDFPPFGYVNPEGKVEGFDVDLAREFAERWLGQPDAVEFVPVTSETRIPFLASGAVDLVIASLTHTQQRDDLIDFSETYFQDGQSLLVRKASKIRDLDGLSGKTVAAVTGSTSLENIETIAKTRGIKINLLPFNEYPSALQALKAGQVDALTTDRVALTQFAKDNPTLAVVGEPFTQEPYGIGVPSFDSEFRDLVNSTLQSIKLDGTYDQLYQKWFGAATPYPIEIWPGATAQLAKPLTPLTDTLALEPTALEPISVEPTPVQRGAATPTLTMTRAKRPTAQLILVPTDTPATPALASATSEQTETPIVKPTETPRTTATPTPTDTPEATATPTPLIHRVVEGDTLAILAIRYYGKYPLWTRIYAANRDKIGPDPNNLVVGMELVIPPEK